MGQGSSETVTITVRESLTVSGLMMRPSGARACYVLAHGAGAGMAHPFLEAIAQGLAERGIASLRFQFPYMEQARKRPDPPHLAHAAVRAAVAKALALAPDLPLIAGGKSFGGRMSSQAQAVAPLTGVRGLAFLGFPLHPAGRPSLERAEHLKAIAVPMLFLQGSRDELAGLGLLEPFVKQLGQAATLKVFFGADHSFHVPARSGVNDAQIRSVMLDSFAEWTDSVIG
jgi:predicted alpha/beta-hydrolase family hydrolase